MITEYPTFDSVKALLSETFNLVELTRPLRSSWERLKTDDHKWVDVGPFETRKTNEGSLLIRFPFGCSIDDTDAAQSQRVTKQISYLEHVIEQVVADRPATLWLAESWERPDNGPNPKNGRTLFFQIKGIIEDK